MEAENDAERSEIREKLSKMTFEEINKLKEKLGTKLYNEAMFGTSAKKKQAVVEFKRVNKNRPREVSSKRPVKAVSKKIRKVVANEIRDPRFDSLCGDFDDRQFRRAYGFIDRIRKKEKVQLIQQLKSVEDPEERKRIRIEIQRIKNKEREETKKIQKEEKLIAERQDKIKMLQDGKKPHFKSKLENKVTGLLEQYNELKKSGKLQKHIEKHRKKVSQKEKKMGYLDEA